MVCTNCGTEMSGVGAFCTMCGEGRQKTGSGAAIGTPDQSRPKYSPTAAHARGFISSLFDFSFHSFITGKLIKVLYMLAMIMAGILALAVIVSGFSVNSAVGLAALIFSPLAFLIVVAYSRVGLEIIMVVFRIEEHLAVAPPLASASPTWQPGTSGASAAQEA